MEARGRKIVGRLVALVVLWPLVASIARADAGDAGIAAQAALGEPVVVFAAKSPFERVFVVDEGPLRFLRFGTPAGTDQSVVDRRDPRRIPMPYLQVATFATLLVEPPRRALIVGLGGGSFAGVLRRQFPGVLIDAVEIDPVVVEAAKRYFGLVVDDRLALHVVDAAAFLERQADAGAYDLVLLDAYSGDGIPPHLTSAAFFERVGRQLSPTGIALANLAPSTPDEGARLVARFARAFRGDCLALRAIDDDNLVLAAAHYALPQREETERLARNAERNHLLPFPVEPIARTRRSCSVPEDGFAQRLPHRGE